MEYILLILSFICLIVGLFGSFLPVLPGPPVSWIGVLLLYLTKGIPFSHAVVWGTLLIAVVVTVLDYVIPALGTKRFGGSSFGVWGTNIGLIIGLFFPPFGFIIGPFLGALAGEFINDSKDFNKALKAALGSFLGFLASTLIKLVVCILFLILFFIKIWEYREVWF